MTGLSKGNNQFAVDLYRKLSSSDGDENIFISPFSISTALAMAYAGARNNTAKQMASVLHFVASQGELHAGFSQLIEQTKSTPTSGYILKIANALWGKADTQFESAFLRITEKYYQGSFKRHDFSVPSRTVEAVNTWAAENTENKITDVVAPADVPTDMELLLANAIYFKGDWAVKFEKAATTNLPFTLTSGQTINVPTMSQEREFAAHDGGHVQALELPYAGEQLSMLILLPSGKLDEFETTLTFDTLESIRSELKRQGVKVLLPRFLFDAKFHLKHALVELGIKDAFDVDAADFSGISEQRVNIGDLVHKAFIDVNEEGSEAAAVTVLTLRAAGAPRPPMLFKADHPFLFAIIHKPTNSILFMGRVADPSPKVKS